MELKSTREGTNLIVDVEGRVDGTNAMDFQAALEGAIEQSDLGVVMDMGQLQYISSAGLRVILLVAKSLQKQNAKLMGCSLSESVREIFAISGFDKIVPVHDSRADALKALQD